MLVIRVTVYIFVILRNEQLVFLYRMISLKIQIPGGIDEVWGRLRVCNSYSLVYFGYFRLVLYLPSWRTAQVRPGLDTLG